MAHASTVPIALDSTPPADRGDSLVRVIYFRITAEDPNSPMILRRGAREFPFILLGLEGIVLGPANDGELFQSPRDIDELIDLIEGIRPDQPGEPLGFETSSIWLPYQVLEQSKTPISSRSEKGDAAVERGDVFRLSPEAFRKAWLYLDSRVDEASLRDFFQFANDSSVPQPPAVIFSPVETKAFRRWSEGHLGGQAQLSMNTP